MFWDKNTKINKDKDFYAYILHFEQIISVFYTNCCFFKEKPSFNM